VAKLDGVAKEFAAKDRLITAATSNLWMFFIKLNLFGVGLVELRRYSSLIEVVKI
jgi:hypothetical protein